MTMKRILQASVVGALILNLVAPARADDAPLPVPKPMIAPPKSLTIEVISAGYGHSGAHTSCIVTPLVKRSCNGRSRCTVKADDELCQPPSAVPAGLILTLTVEYKCAPLVTPLTAHAEKPFQVVIDCGNAAGHFSPKVEKTP